MSTHTGIEWTDRTWNPVTGCSEISPGCAHCYAARLAATRLAHHAAYQDLAIVTADGTPRFTGELRFHPDRLDEPRLWRKPSRVFVNSMSDLFHENMQDEWIRQIVDVIRDCPQHTFQVLTKRPRRMLTWVHDFGGVPPLLNLWLGVSVENQYFADYRIPLLLNTPAAVRFISAEPLLGPIDLRDHYCYIGNPACPSLDWVIAGGESGPGARPTHPEWIRSLRDQCVSAGVPFFFKQWGAWVPSPANTFRLKSRAGQLLALRVDRLTECGEARELTYEAYPLASNDDAGPIDVLQNFGAHKKWRELDGHEWNQFPCTAPSPLFAQEQVK